MTSPSVPEPHTATCGDPSLPHDHPASEAVARVLRVAFISQPRDGLKATGEQSGSVAIVLAKLAAALGPEMETIAVAPAMQGQVEAEPAADGLTIHRVAAGSREREKLLELVQPGPLPRLLSTAYYRGYFERAAAALAPLRPDIVHLMTSAPAGPIFRRALPGVPLVLHLHDDMLTRVEPSLTAAWIEPFAAVVTCSDWLADELRAHVPAMADRIRPVGNGIDPALFGEGAPPAEHRPVRRLMMVGRVSPEKGPHILLEAFSRLARDWPDVELVLAGPLGLLPLGHARLMARNNPAMAAAVASFYGQGLSAVRSQFWKPAQTLQARLLAPVPAQLHDRIRFLGAQPHDRLADLYRAADMLVQPSVCREGYGLPVAEAMAVGLPVVAANHGGLLDLVVPGETGLLVPPGDVAALADAIETLLREPARAHAFGTAGRTRALRCFTWRRAALRLAEVYRDVCR